MAKKEVVEAKDEDLVVIQSKLKDAVKGPKGEMNCSSDFAAGMSKLVRMVVASAIKTAKENGRKTVRASDIPFI